LADRPPAPEPSSPQGPPGGPAPSLGEQIGRTREALLGLASAHLKLLSAELSEIMDQVKRTLALAGAALGLLVLAGLFAALGTIFWLDEWAFGSIGWGALHGTTLTLAMAVVLALVIVPNSGPRLGLAFFVSLLVAIVVGVVFWLQLTNRAWAWVGDTFVSGLAWPGGGSIAVADRPVVVAVAILAVFAGVVGLLVGFAVGRGLANRLTSAIVWGIVAALVGGLVGGLLGVPMSWGCAVAVDLAAFLIMLPILALVFVLPEADWDELKNRLMPNQTIDTTKETIEWVREQMPLGRKS
jgi:hypothetical protein